MNKKEFKEFCQKKEEERVERRKSAIHCLALLEKITSAYVWMLNNQKVRESEKTEVIEQRGNTVDKIKKASTLSLAYLSHVLDVSVEEVMEESKKIWESCELNTEE